MKDKFRDFCGSDKLLIGDGGTRLSNSFRTFSSLPFHCINCLLLLKIKSISLSHLN